MRILVISGFAKPSEAPISRRYGGLEWISSLTAYGFARKGYDVTFIGAKGSRIENADVELITPIEPEWKGLETERRAYEEYKHLLPEYDYILDDSHFKWSYLSKKEDPSLRMIWRWHDWASCSSPPPVKVMHVAPSKAHAEHLEQFLDEVHVIPHGLPIEFYEFQKEKKNYLLFFSRLSPYKGALEAIKVAKKTRHHLKVAGMDKNVESPNFVAEVMWECQQCGYDYYGEVDFRTKIELFKNAKAVLLPLLEPYRGVFEIIVLESLATNTPIIATDLGAPREIIEHGESGFVVKHPNEMPQYIERLNEIDPENCRRRAEDFGMEKMVDALERLFTSSLSF